MLAVAVLVICGCSILLAAALLAVARSPPAAYAAATLGVVAIGGVCITLFIIWLTAA
jgi:hypothetical protein